MKTSLLITTILGLGLPLFSHAKANTELKQYQKLTKNMNQQLVILKDADKCGNIGSKVAKSMDKGINDLNEQTKEVSKAVTQGPAGRPTIENYVKVAKENFEKIDSHKGLVLWGLDGNKPECVTATKAFLALHDLQAEIPKQLSKISMSL